MESDSIRQIKTQSEEASGDMDPDPGDILQPSWIRCPLCSGNEMDRFLLDYGRYFYCLSAFFFGLYFLFFREKPKHS
jgi:hypothetical protein